jgi:hypothetical protein
MPKGIRKACANCIKARLACDEGRPCQRCVVHACECIAVPRKPRVKKQKIDMEPPPAMITDKLNIPSIDSNVDVVLPNWSQNEYAQGSFGAFQLERSVPESNESLFDGYAPNTLLSPSLTTPRSPTMFLDTFQLSPPMMQMPSPITSQIPSPPQVYATPSSPPIWTEKQLQAALVQQLISTQAPLQGHLQQTQAQTPQSITPILHPIQPVHTIQPQAQQTQPQRVQQIQQYAQDLKAQLRQGYDQMLSLLLEEKPSTLLNEVHEGQSGTTYVDGQGQTMNIYDPSVFKKQFTSPLSALPQPMNATPLYPAPIAVFDKIKFQLLDANNAMANFLGLASVAEMATKVTYMDDLIDSDAAQIAKQAYTNFVSNPSPCFRLGEIRTHNGSGAKTVEFHVDLTEQLLILTIKSVFDSSSKGLPDVQYQQMPIKMDPSMQQSKAFEFLSPID